MLPTALVVFTISICALEVIFSIQKRRGGECNTVMNKDMSNGAKMRNMEAGKELRLFLVEITVTFGMHW